jgi:hypothetical protein
LAVLTEPLPTDCVHFVSTIARADGQHGQKARKKAAAAREEAQIAWLVVRAIREDLANKDELGKESICAKPGCGRRFFGANGNRRYCCYGCRVERGRHGFWCDRQNGFE